MKIWGIFRDDNKINEKSVVGFISFAFMVVYGLLHLLGPVIGYELEINEIIYSSFVTVTLGSFGISEVSKVVHAYGEARTAKEIAPRNHPTDESTDEVDDYHNTE